jgi:hypothetical protein
MASNQPLTVATAPPRPGFFRLLWRLLRQLFHEVTGALFLLMAFSWTASAFRIWRHGATSWLWGASATFAILMIFFGLSAFHAARRVR